MAGHVCLFPVVSTVGFCVVKDVEVCVVHTFLGMICKHP